MGDVGRRAVLRQERGEGSRTFRLAEDEDLAHAGPIGGFSRLLETPRHRDEKPGAGVLELVPELVRRVDRIHGRAGPARQRHRVECDRVFGNVGTEDPEHVALAKASRRESPCAPAHALGPLAVGERAPRGPVDEGGLVGPPRGALQQETRQVRLGDLDVGSRTAVDHRCPPIGLPGVSLPRPYSGRPIPSIDHAEASGSPVTCRCEGCPRATGPGKWPAGRRPTSARAGCRSRREGPPNSTRKRNGRRGTRRPG